MVTLPGLSHRRRQGGPWNLRPRAMGRALLVSVLLAAILGCAEPELRKRSFMASSRGMREQADVPVGLNPLGSLDTCHPGDDKFTLGNRVLVSRPEFFTRAASGMISTLREALAQSAEGLPAVEFLLTERPITSQGEATRLGLQCGAVIVLWEPGQTKTLELTLPHPNQIPLKPLARKRLCEFGNHQQQLDILYLTIAGLLTLRVNDYDRAILYMETARTIDGGCLHIPARAAPAPRGGQPAAK